MTTNAKSKLDRAHGKAILLSIGVSSYADTSGFSELPTCKSDAIAIRQCFAELPQLNSRPDSLRLLVDGEEQRPSRGTILKEVMSFARNARSSDRLFFYFSGHGHRIGDELYLVPEDAYSDSEPTAMVSFKQIIDILSASQAKQKLLLIDACYSGTIRASEKLVAAKVSETYLRKYLRNTKGLVVLSSSSNDQASYTKSPDKTLSLFTYFLVQALKGLPEAIDEDEFLTVDSVFDYLSVSVDRYANTSGKSQNPVLYSEASGVIVIGDYSKPDNDFTETFSELLSLNSISVLLSEDINTSEVLRNIKYYSHYTPEYLEGLVNRELPTYLSDIYQEFAAYLVNTYDIEFSDIQVNATDIELPYAQLYNYYYASDVRYGILFTELHFQKYWFSRPKCIVSISNWFRLDSFTVKFHFSKNIDISIATKALRAGKWKITSLSEDKIEAEHPSEIGIAISGKEISFEGGSLLTYFTSEGDQESRRLILSTLYILSL